MKAANSSIPPLCLKLLRQRGLKEPDEIVEFLYPKLKDLPAPTGLKGAVEGAKLVRLYLENDLQIVIWGDYDVDGTTATGLLVNFFKKLGVKVIYHIPNRLTEGYGLNLEWFTDAVSQFKSKKFLLISVDCGIANAKEISSIQEMGGEVVVTDHHSIPQNGIPDCIVINPSQDDCNFRAEKLAGVGVAFYLVAAIRAELLKSKSFKTSACTINLKQFLAFTALGTVADLVEMTATNRILVRAGMESLKETNFPGLKALLGSSGLYEQDISSEDIGFILGPKINAAGRLGKSNVAIDLLLSEDEGEARKLSEALERLNNTRKSICEDDYDYAIATISPDLVSQQFLCVCAGDYHVGVAGIVASRLVEELKVPTVVFADTQDSNGSEILKGSIRSIEGVSVIDALNGCSEIIEKYGGHDMAAGLTIKKELLSVFTQQFSEKLKGQRGQIVPSTLHSKATETSVDEVMDSNTLDILTKFEPFGPGNDMPIFIDKHSRIIQARTVGKLDSHLNLVVRGEYSNYRGIAFNLGDKVSLVQEQPDRMIYFSPTKNRYRGTVSWQLRVVELL